MRWGLAFLWLGVCWVMLGSAPLAAASLSPAEAQAQADTLYRALRCPNCPHQALNESDTSLAQDMRTLITQKIAAGESPRAIKAYLVERYGDRILLNPPLKTHTLVLWLSPFVVFALACGGLLPRLGKTFRPRQTTRRRRS